MVTLKHKDNDGSVISFSIFLYYLAVVFLYTTTKQIMIQHMKLIRSEAFIMSFYYVYVQFTVQH